MIPICFVVSAHDELTFMFVEDDRDWPFTIAVTGSLHCFDIFFELGRKLGFIVGVRPNPEHADHRLTADNFALAELFYEACELVVFGRWAVNTCEAGADWWRVDAVRVFCFVDVFEVWRAVVVLAVFIGLLSHGSLSVQGDSMLYDYAYDNSDFFAFSLR